MKNEPSVLDYVKALLTPWRGAPPPIPPLEEPVETAALVSEAQPASEEEPIPTVEVSSQRTRVNLPWRVLGGLVLALAAQRLLEPPDRSPKTALVFYALGAVFFVWALLVNDMNLIELKRDEERSLPLEVRWKSLLLSLPLLALVFLAMGDNRFTDLNVILWVAAMGYTLLILWVYPQRVDIRDWLTRVAAWIRQPDWQIRLSRWGVLLLLVTALVVFFRVSHLNQVPNEMFSDQAEKLLDVSDVLSGQTSIFFPRNTGREGLQMYLTAAVAQVLGTGISFMSLKIGTVLAGLLMLIYMYKLGCEVGNRWVGLLVLLLAGIGYWPNVISRIGLRFPLYPLFVAPALYYLIRGLRTTNRNDFLLSGLALGIGLHGYSPIRILPLVLAFGVLLYVLHRQSRGNRWQAVFALVLLAFTALVVFIPLGRYVLDNPEMFALRAFSRLGSTERPLPGPALVIFLQNMWRASIMMFWDNGNIWVHSIPGRPALDVVTAALYFAGVILLLARYIRRRNWLDLFLLCSIPLLMMPSILSLAFPEENPALNRASGAIVPIFLIAALALEAIVRAIKERMGAPGGRTTAWIVGLVLIFWSCLQNYDLTINQFGKQFAGGAWNTSEMGAVIRAFADSVGSADTAHVVPYPYWVDTRLVGITAGYPTTDYAIQAEMLPATKTETRAQLFILNIEDAKTLETLRGLYPQGSFSRHTSSLEGKDFIIFFAPPTPGGQ